MGASGPEERPPGRSARRRPARDPRGGRPYTVRAMRRFIVPLAAALFVLALVLLTLRLAPRLLPGLRPAAPAAPGFPSLDAPLVWWNGGPVAADSLRGHPVVALLWSGADPRASTALATLEAWNAAYRPLGVRVLAIHVPEYAYGADTSFVGARVRREAISFPVASDPAGVLAARFGGATEGPHVVVADGNGRVIVDEVGNLARADAALHAWAVRTHGPGAPPALSPPPLPAVRIVRLGAGENDGGPLKGLAAGYEGVFTAEFRYQEQGRRWLPFPVGGWRLRADGLEVTRGGAANFAAIRYSAARVGVVVSPPAGARGRLWILLDDHWPAAELRGEDVVADSQGAAYVEIATPGLYWIERGRGERVLKLSPEESGVTLHALVFEDGDRGDAPR